MILLVWKEFIFLGKYLEGNKLVMFVGRRS